MHTISATMLAKWTQGRIMGANEGSYLWSYDHDVGVCACATFSLANRAHLGFIDETLNFEL